MPRTSVLERASVGLTTSESPFIEEAVGRGQLYIHQPYELYSEENHEAWRKLYSRSPPNPINPFGILLPRKGGEEKDRPR